MQYCLYCIVLRFCLYRDSIASSIDVEQILPHALKKHCCSSSSCCTASLRICSGCQHIENQGHDSEYQIAIQCISDIAVYMLRSKDMTVNIKEPFNEFQT